MTHKLPDHDTARVALFPGSFNPFTKGHLSVLERFSPLFVKIIVAVGVNAGKPAHPAQTSRNLAAIKQATGHLANVEVKEFSGLTVDFAVGEGAGYIIRGVRDVADFEYERKMADVNRLLTGVETVFVFSLPEHQAISSSVVRELESYGRDVSQFLP